MTLNAKRTNLWPRWKHYATNVFGSGKIIDYWDGAIVTIHSCAGSGLSCCGRRESDERSFSEPANKHSESDLPPSAIRPLLAMASNFFEQYRRA
jgi:hypothetical protein